ncbi:MAG TPA: Uma2 family endonuclease [Blastocatellia bacterium]|nr:Uma2 family endonuclease [Blastocatellia bacterium]
MTDEQLFDFCQVHRDLRIERTANGDLIIMPPTGGETSNRNMALAIMLGNWSWHDGTGEAFDSNGGFFLPNGAMRSPDASWVKGSRLIQLTDKEKQKFLPLCPDFVIELLSPSDSLAEIQEKMQEYIENGAQLGWLIDPRRRQVHVYRPNKEIEVLENPSELSGESVLPGFVLDLTKVWKSKFI